MEFEFLNLDEHICNICGFSTAFEMESINFNLKEEINYYLKQASYIS